jgi:hypothetical protein
MLLLKTKSAGEKFPYVPFPPYPRRQLLTNAIEGPLKAAAAAPAKTRAGIYNLATKL